MRKVREVLRLYHAAGMSIRAIARSVGVSPTTAGDYVRRAVSGQTRTYLRLLVQSVWWRVVRVMPESGGQGVMGES